jgi:hypothetical protein
MRTVQAVATEEVKRARSPKSADRRFMLLAMVPYDKARIAHKLQIQLDSGRLAWVATRRFGIYSGHHATLWELKRTGPERARARRRP